MASTAEMDPSMPASTLSRARDGVDDDAVSTVRKSLTKSGGVCTPFDARRATTAAGISLPFEEMTSLMRRARGRRRESADAQGGRVPVRG